MKWVGIVLSVGIFALSANARVEATSPPESVYWRFSYWNDPLRPGLLNLTGDGTGRLENPRARLWEGPEALQGAELSKFRNLLGDKEGVLVQASEGAGAGKLYKWDQWDLPLITMHPTRPKGTSSRFERIEVPVVSIGRPSPEKSLVAPSTLFPLDFFLDHKSYRAMALVPAFDHLSPTQRPDSLKRTILAYFLGLAGEDKGLFLPVGGLEEEGDYIRVGIRPLAGMRLLTQSGWDYQQNYGGNVWENIREASVPTLPIPRELVGEISSHSRARVEAHVRRNFPTYCFSRLSDSSPTAVPNPIPLSLSVPQ